MVLPGEEEDYMATEHERSKTRHNFTLPKWGIQRALRCVKVESDGESDAAGDRRPSRPRRRSSPSEIGGATPVRFGGGFENRNRYLETEPWRFLKYGVEEGFEEYRARLMSHLRTTTESIFRKQAPGDEEKTNEREELEPPEKEELEPPAKEREVSPPEAPVVAVEVKPWNLRKRRAACKAPITDTGNSDANQYKNYKGLEIHEDKRVSSSISGNKSETKPRRLLSTLSKKEIEEDYMALVGHRPPRRPKKRSRTVQKQIELLYPALYISEITPDMYKVSDAAENGKR
ncbi:uncharacterized protein LOC18009175 [Eutrema salsugineum]|nr:uncharacterized protein LOC18009175 [Eutrema salsugineum]